MALPSFVNVGAQHAATPGGGTVALPSGIQAGDVLLLFVECNGTEVVTISDAAGGTWAALPDSPVASGSATRLTGFWSRYNGTQTAPTISGPSDHTSGGMVAYRGCVATGNPWDSHAAGTGSGSGVSITGATSTVADCLVVAASCAGTDASAQQFSAWANADLTNVAERMDYFSGAGGGGGVGVADGGKAVAGAYGATTATVATGVKAFMQIALQPDTTAPTPNITVGPSTLKISRVSGKDVTTFSFQSDEPYQAYELRVVPSTSSPHTAGTLIESGGAGGASTNRDVDVTDDELVAASGTEGDNVVKVFVQDNAGNWSG
jgi:hypothetical protein